MSDTGPNDKFAELDESVREKLNRCREILRKLQRVIVAFSGGTDSSMLLAMAAETLGTENVLAVMAVSTIFPQRERTTAGQIADLLGVELKEFETPQLADANFTANPTDRCYYCKAMLLGRLKKLADEGGFSAVITGSNADDENDYRPGRRAEQQLGVRCPLAESGLTKSDIRSASRAMGLPNWDRPAFACLATRIPYGREITAEKLSRIDQSEEVLLSLDFPQCRVRDHDTIARIEVPADLIERAVALRESIAGPLKALGYTYVALDLEGFRSGSMNEGIRDNAE
ncbi:MAG: ATP-dependent sacrificial sulfur transferase LarE [Planctomycetota bacterium]|nr:ATP-dependent sacrificial sulfur transferase LarE [Planctomycetota bacterium]